MKKIISLLLLACLLVSLFACGGSTQSTTGSSSPSSAASSSASPSPAATPSASASASASPSAPAADPSTTADEIGFFKSGVDPKSRDTYNIVFAYTRTLLLFEKMYQCFTEYADDLNVTVTPTTSEMDMDKYMVSIETYAEQGADGFIIVIDPATRERTIDVLNETGVPYISLFNSVRNEKGNSRVPTIGLDQYAAGAATLQWQYDNYKSVWGNIDTSKLGLLSFTMSISVDLNARALGTEDLFRKLFPNNAGLVYSADGASESGSGEDIGYNLTAANLTAHPEVQYWFITTCLEMYAQGAARAVEQLGKDKVVMITTVGSDIATTEWENGYEGAFNSCLAISNYLYAAPTICGLVSMIDGVSTPESLWPDMKKDGDIAAFYTTDSQVITKATYKDYFNGIAGKAGMPLPFAK